MNGTLLTAIAAIIVSVIGALASIASSKSASKGSTAAAQVQAETEAYNRARKFDTDTITRQKEMIDELLGRIEAQDLRLASQDAKIAEQSAKIDTQADEIASLEIANKNLLRRVGELETTVEENYDG